MMQDLNNYLGIALFFRESTWNVSREMENPLLVENSIFMIPKQKETLFARMYQDTMQANKGKQFSLVLKLVRYILCHLGYALSLLTRIPAVCLIS